VRTPATTLRPTWAGSLYVLGVAAVSTFGFTSGSTLTILLAALMALPSSIVAVPAYYVVYGMLALLPGANPSSSTGSGSCAPNGDCQMSSAGEAAAWFTFTTEAVGILALTAAALLNAIVVQNLIAARRARTQRPPQAHG
jgi:hypothetical protein